MLWGPLFLLLYGRASQARGSDLRVHFKNTRESAAAIRGLSLAKAKAYLEAVVDHKRCIPFLRYNGKWGRGGSVVLVWVGWERVQRDCCAAEAASPHMADRVCMCSWVAQRFRSARGMQVALASGAGLHTHQCCQG